MDEKQAQGTAHRVMIQGRHSGTISGVSDVLSFDLNEIVLQTTQGMLMIRGQELHMNRLTLEKGEVDIEGKIDSLFIPNRKERTEKIPPFLDGCSGNAHGDRSRGPLFCAGLCKRSRYHAGLRYPACVSQRISARGPACRSRRLFLLGVRLDFCVFDVP